MIKRALTLALVAGAAWFTQANAVAGELTLFSRPGFGGRDITLQGPVRNLTDMGFNDRASSLVVRSGRWELCEHADFRGECITLGPGEYADLNRLGDRLSSLREVGGGRGWQDRERRERWEERRDERRDERRELREERRGEWRDGERGGPAIELFRHAEFQGDRRELSEQSLRDFQMMDFNDRAQSIIIHYGQWEFCEHADFRGRCQVYGPGRYPHLGQLSSQLSSVRRVR
ncbi:MAG: beta/gamma crystallin family protein [Gammaproteobacteria bacterium]